MRRESSRLGRRIAHWLVVLVASATLLSRVAFADADAKSPAPRWRDPQAHAHYDRGRALFEEGKYEEAIGQLLLGQSREARPEFLYALAQCERRRGNCGAAIAYYREFLALLPRARDLVQPHIAHCEE